MTNKKTVADVKLAQLRCFVAVAEERSFKAAAASLFRSQPAVSIAIKELEKTLGADLLERGTGSQLTPYGEQVYGMATQLLDDYGRSVRAMLDAAGGRRGAIRFASVPSLARVVLPYAMEKFIEYYPEVDIHVSDGDTAFVRNAVVNGEADFGFCGEVSVDKRLTFTEMLHDRMGVVCSKRHTFAVRDSISWPDLKDERLIGNGTMSSIKGQVREAIEQYERIYIPNTTSLLAVVQANMGVTILPELVLPFGATEELCFIPLIEPKVTRAIGLLTLAKRSLSPAAQAFYEQVVKELTKVELVF